VSDSRFYCRAQIFLYALFAVHLSCNLHLLAI
jgi:hypothetical protein